ncbi:vacuolar protein sorting-associated protein 45 [Puccinia graminis f. sp. tritici]|uniref:Vacuolar protein sorting-associated protein 45 n=1 Tax=Puccinia graminis f. sp. tritici TaxID=56615 RepID=A0A5B0P787_PUCGR|nr:vacuolar protein sorting-associated protein 45 [Puccinia graminis f. sp. tritici]KAA1131921.1 vacuolar protein sorting-associated protein 45 [Puccinia graminis f. sp. tritici]
MDLLKSIQNYINKMINQSPGIKVLLLDSDTTAIISLAATQSNLLEHEIYLTDSIANTNRDPMHHLKCICFLRPTAESLKAMEEELRNPRYKEYWLYFSNILKKSEIEMLAEADERELVREVQEYFADYAPITSSHFSLNLQPYNPPQNSHQPTTISLSSLVAQPTTPPAKKPSHRSLPLFGDSTSTWNISTGALERHVQCLSALCLSLKKKPVIRYAKMSKMAKKLGQELQYQMQSEHQLFDFRLTHPSPVLLILDRKHDPVSPLLTQWTYQAMVHEILGIDNGRVDLSGAPEIRAELKEIVLSTEQDPFFAKNLYANFGDLGASVKAYVSEYQTKTVSSKLVAGKIDTVQDMKRFLEEYPEHRKLSGNVSKHVSLVGELSRLVGELKLLEVSELEQSLAANESHGSDLKNVREMIASPQINTDAKLRLALLYALRYQKFNGNCIVGIVELLKQYSVSEQDARLVYVMLNFAGQEERQDDLFSNANFFSRGKSALKGLKGVENVYTQHTPPLVETVEQLLKGRLKETGYPILEPPTDPSKNYHSSSSTANNQSSSAAAQNLPTRPIEVVVFVVGGSTYEEARSIALLNDRLASGVGFSGPGPQPQLGARVILGGTYVHNSRTFLDWLRDLGTKYPEYTEPKPSLIASGSSQGDMSFGDGGFNLQLGNLSVNVGSGAGGGGANGAGSRPVAAGLEEFGDAAVDGVRNLFGRVRKGVVGGF